MPQGGSTEIGVYSDRVVFGQSAALSGPAAELGVGMRLGILAAFEEANRAGGVSGRRLELRSLDDSYEPEAAIANTAELIDSSEVFALIGAVGTPTSRSATPVAASAGIPYVATRSRGQVSCATTTGPTSSTCVPLTPRKPKRWLNG